MRREARASEHEMREEARVASVPLVSLLSHFFSPHSSFLQSRNLELPSPVSFMTAAAAGNPDHLEHTRGNSGNTGNTGNTGSTGNFVG
jgi:hypothetical protein